ncbi:MAG TPA: phosphatidate cytidylyltransferase [Acidobacteriaceae bacterium]|jgi:phosphatidate cytidylyltransferase
MTRVLLILWPAFLVGAVGLYAASRKVAPAVRRERLTKFVTYFCIVNGLLLGAFAGRIVFSGIMLVVAVLGARELIAVLPAASGGRRSAAWAMGAAYLAIAVGAVLFAWRARAEVAAVAYLVVCTFDGFSQVTGQLLGRHKLTPRLSPGKTIEGSVGGLLFAVGMAFLLRPVAGWSVSRCLEIACFLAVVSLVGDLLASYVKRRSGIKDFGRLLPGHGGILDRFDSFLFAAAAWSVAAAVAQAGLR